MKIDIKKYQRQNNEKLDAVTTAISIEKKHKSFLEKYNVNLSALIRDVLNKIMSEPIEAIEQSDKEIEEIKNENS